MNVLPGSDGQYTSVFPVPCKNYTNVLGIN